MDIPRDRRAPAKARSAIDSLTGQVSPSVVPEPGYVWFAISA